MGARGIRWVGLIAGPLAGVACFLVLPDHYAAPTGETVVFDSAGRATAAVALWMAIWWMTEALPVSATALLPLAVFPTTGATTMRAAASPYAHELIFLFMGGFMLALAMQRWKLDRRIALIALRAVGARLSRVVGAFMFVAALLSMWVSNSATAVMMMPIAASVLDLVLREMLGREVAPDQLPPGRERNFAVCLMLGVAYGASIGGMGTLIGTPPNLFLASFAKEILGIEISFARWMLVGLPLVAILLPLSWWILTRMALPLGDVAVAGVSELARSTYRELGPPSRGEWATLTIFSLTAGAWVFRPLLPGNLSDPAIAMMAALALFALPIHPAQREFVLDWRTAEKLPWGVLLLFGGGLSLASALQDNGVDGWIGAQLHAAEGLPPLLLVLLVAVVVIFLTELTSNTATAATLLPLLAALAPALGVPALQLLVPAALAASCAFMLPVATPPNAVVFGTGYLRVADMMRAGFWLNWVAVGVITAITYGLALRVL